MIFMILLTLWNSEQKNRLLIKLFCFSSDFDETWWSCSYPCVLPFHQVSSKSDEKQKSFINCPFFCSEFQSVSRIVKIVYSWLLHPKIIFFFQTGRLDTFHNYTFSRFWNIVCCTETFSALLSSKIWQLIHKTRYWAFIRTVMAILLHKVVSQNLRVMDSVL